MSTTAGIIIISDQVLSGKVIDTNSSYLCKQFHALGIRVCKISTIPNKADVIKSEVKSFSNSFNIVITTGGIGLTYDDVTYEGVASAFNVPLQPDEHMRKFITAFLKQNYDPGVEKRFMIPSSADIILAKNPEYPLVQSFEWYPVVKMRNVYCLTGSPIYVRAIFPTLASKYLKNNRTIYFSRTIYLAVDKTHVVTLLNELARKFDRSVTFGSCSLERVSEEGLAETKIILESTSLTNCLEAEKLFISRSPPSWIIYPKTGVPDFAFIERLNAIDTELSYALKASYQTIEECFSQFTIDETFLCFNGGKDCTVLLNLVCSVCAQKKFKQRLKLLYFQEVDAFHEVDEFIEDIAKNYHVDVCTLPMPMKDSLRVFLTQDSNKKACFMGLRNTDPRGEHLNPIQETDSDWPKVFRVSPLLHWTYKNIWDFLRCTNVPYCSLYNRGYSSLGNKNNTLPNPALKFTSEDGAIHYRPAFFLEDKFERQSRYSATNGNVVRT